MPKITLTTKAEIQDKRSAVLASVERTADWLRSFKGQPLEMLKELRFKPVGYDPRAVQRSL